MDFLKENGRLFKKEESVHLGTGRRSNGLIVWRGREIMENGLW